MKKVIYRFLFLQLFLNISYSQYDWIEQNSGVTTQLNSVCFTSSFYTAWCCGGGGTVLKLIGNGNNWSNKSGNGIPNTATLVNIACLNDTATALVAGFIGTTTYVWRTSNGGTNWVQVFSQANGFINSIWMWGGANALMQGNPLMGRWQLWKSTNYGINWDSTGLYLPQSGSEAGYPNSMFGWNPSTYWFGTNNTRIYYTNNSGNNWIVQSTSPEQNSYVLSFAGGFAMSGGATLMKSTNSGTNWFQISAPGSSNFSGVSSAGQYFWFVRNDNKIYLSSNAGTNWGVHYTAPSGNYKYLFGGSIPWAWGMYAVRDNGGISRYVSYIGIKQISNEIPQKFSLSQNYPNPFNPTTKIRFSVPSGKFDIPQDSRLRGNDNVVLKVYDILGNEVSTLVNEQLKPGTYEVEFNGDNFASGVYYYQLAAGDYLDTKKMILIK
jgi:hypothetical protein